jgi:hypothetical protein
LPKVKIPKPLPTKYECWLSTGISRKTPEIPVAVFLNFRKFGQLDDMGKTATLAQKTGSNIRSRVRTNDQGCVLIDLVHFTRCRLLVVRGVLDNTQRVDL